MNQSWLTVVVAIITALAGVLPSIASAISKRIERKTSWNNESIKELKNLAHNLNNQLAQLRDASFKLMLAYHRKIQFNEKLKQHGTPGDEEWYMYYAKEDADIDGDIEYSEGQMEVISHQVKSMAFDLTIQFPALSKYVNDLIDKARPCHVSNNLDSDAVRDSFNARFSKDFDNETFTGEDKKQWDMAQKNFQQAVARQLKKSH